MTTNYARGRAFEYLTKTAFEKQGYYVMRSSMSHGLLDLIALKDGTAIGIQCKKNNYISPEELKELIKLKEKIGFNIYISYSKKDGEKYSGLFFREVEECMNLPTSNDAKTVEQ